MQTYNSKQELMEAIETSFTRFYNEFINIDPSLIHKKIEAVDKSPYEMIAYQIGWINLVMSWEKEELAGKVVITPTPEYKWNQLGGLYQSFYDEYKNLTLKELLVLFLNSKCKLIDWIDTLSEVELFEPSIRKWTITNANWPMWKWLHINSVAPFKSFRTKIRKWKKSQ